MLWVTLVFVIVTLKENHGLLLEYATPPTIATPPDPSLSCSVDGNIVPNGQNFTTKQNGPCFTFRCENRAFIPVEYRCPLNDKCIAVGSNVTTSKCIVQQCQQDGQSISYQIVKEGCARFDGGCLKIGESYQDGCTTYTCLKEKYTYRLAITDWGCNYGGKCFKPNETLSSQCDVKRCEKRDMMVGMYTVESGCPFVNNTCIKLDEKAIDQCTLYTCVKENINGVPYYRTKSLATMCEDYKGACHQNGSPIEVEIHGSGNVKKIVTCTCEINGMNIGYRC